MMPRNQPGRMRGNRKSDSGRSYQALVQAPDMDSGRCRLHALPDDRRLTNCNRVIELHEQAASRRGIECRRAKLERGC